MKAIMKIHLITLVIGALILITYGCNKENNNDELNAKLSKTEDLLLKSYTAAKAYDDTLKTCVDSLGFVTCPRGIMDDSLYHVHDSLFMHHYLTYCEDMESGDNMMGGNMMGGNNMHGSTMMGNHVYMGDTATINQSYRSMFEIRTNHYSHHPQ
jgi:hypothetical protein